jgi:integrase/recombinase XerD
MTSLRQAVQDYLSLRRSLGFKLRCAGALLLKFAAFAEARGIEYVTVSLALEWATLPPHQKPPTWADRMKAVRVFAQYQHAIDARTEVPPFGLLPYRPPRLRPYLYTDEEIKHLLEATARLRSTRGIRPHTYYCLLGLLTVSGLRISEALALRKPDVDLPAGILTIRGTKFGKSRFVPLHPSAVNALRHYAQQRDLLIRSSTSDSFFVSDFGRLLEVSAVRRTFYELSRWAGLRQGEINRGPRLHDFRHRFAVQTMIQWYRSGQDVERRLPILSTYLGHAHVSDTYWYLTHCPELMEWGVKRLESRWEVLP